MEMYKMLSRDELKTIKAALEEEYAKASDKRGVGKVFREGE